MASTFDGVPSREGSRPAATVTVRAMGRWTPILVTGEDGRRVAEFAASLESAWSRCDPSSAIASVVTDATPPLTGTPSSPISVDLDQVDALAALAWVSTAVTTRSIDEFADAHLLLHAAACADESSGLAACFVGPSGRGKTTASIALGRDLGYLTDEATAVDGRGRVVPYPKPLSVRRGDAAVKEQRSPDALGLRRATPGHWSLGALFLLDRRPAVVDADGVPATEPTTAEPVPLADAIVALAPELSSLDRLDRPLQRIASLVDRTGPVLSLHYTEAASLAPVVRGVLADRRDRARPSPEGVPREDWRALDVQPPPADVSASVGSYRRTPALDAIDAADVLVVLRPGRVVTAGGLAVTIWQQTRDWTATDALRAALEPVVGWPDRADSLLDAALAAMCEAGLLERAGS